MSSDENRKGKEGDVVAAAATTAPIMRLASLELMLVAVAVMLLSSPSLSSISHHHYHQPSPPPLPLPPPPPPALPPAIPSPPATKQDGILKRYRQHPFSTDSITRDLSSNTYTNIQTHPYKTCMSVCM
ncbi:hypothetical protein WUBG_10458 [Wuchereria bancrofti]|uniref:Uncharacterized protein n=1 Tax=Wuchereria bancrofti TaxID=6293 RepID=J9E942_WUCBA|nr:hypothetical protein WUBG_10458 [Wuchereria bancrofti]